MSALRYYPYMIAGIAVLAASTGYILFRRRKSPEDLERERRQKISAIGRITDGNVMGVEEVTGDSNRTIHLLIYNYDVSGVTYEASQDITHLQQQIDLRSRGFGQAASVKYDPQNPGNSIVIAEGWSGIRTLEARR